MPNTEQPPNNGDVEHNDIPSIFVNVQIPPNTINVSTTTGYSINGSVYFMDDIMDDSVVEYEVHGDEETVKKLKMDGEEWFTPGESEDENEDNASALNTVKPSPSNSVPHKLKDFDKPLCFTKKEVPHGYIINLTVYLTGFQWNTLSFIDVKLVECAVCEMFSELELCSSHMETETHKRNLESNKPLEKFEMSIVRRIKNNYHCAVCNELFDVSDDLDHFGGKIHEGNLLFAINKAADLIYDYELNEDGNNDKKQNNDKKLNNDKKPNNDCYHFNGNNINDSGSSRSYTPVKNYNNFTQYQDDDDSITSTEYPESASPTFTGISYANIAKIPKIHMDKFLCKDLGRKKVKVNIDSWHMIISPEVNKFYCMVCKKYDHIRLKTEHCCDEEHVNNLDKCRVVEEYEEYFIRQVDDKLYHCGHCNNLQLIHEMEDHIETTHPKKPRGHASPIKTTIKASNDIIIKNRNNDNTTAYPNRNNDAKMHIESKQQTQINPNTNIYDKNINNYISKNNDSANNDKQTAIYADVIVYPFGYKMGIPWMSYNIICKRPNDFYCGLCDVLCQDNMIMNHACEIRHIQLMQRTPFIEPFNCHLIRAIREALHCAICNIPVSAGNIYHHISEPLHLETLGKALGINRPIDLTQRPPHMGEIENFTTGKNPPKKNLEDKKVMHNIRNIEMSNQTKQTQRSFSVNESILSIQKEFDNKNSQATPNIAKSKPIQIDIHQLPLEYYNNTTDATITIAKTDLSVQNEFRSSQNDFKSGQNDFKSGQNDFKNGQNEFKTGQNDFKTGQNDFITGQNDFITGQNDFRSGQNDFRSVQNDFKTGQDDLRSGFNDATQDNEYIAEHSEEIEEFTLIISEKEEETDSFEALDNTFESTDDVVFDDEENVYLNVKNTFLKITNASYNTLVHIGDGSRMCFICSMQVDASELQRHVESRLHMENLESYRFLEKYESHLLRQIFLMYHCSICNVVVSRKELRSHLEWETHTVHKQNTAVSKKTRANDLKSGLKQIVVNTQREHVYLNEREPNYKICLSVEVVNKKVSVNTEAVKTDPATDSTEKLIVNLKKNKIIILNSFVYKLGWMNWHGIAKSKNAFKCLLCRKEMHEEDIEEHCSSEWHNYALDKPFEKKYSPALIRKLSESNLNCVICNTEVSNIESAVIGHVKGKKHKRVYESILEESSGAETYSDCNDNILML